jgi:hypothetical protein
MMRFSIPVLLLFIIRAHAQNYACRSLEYKTFFTNGLGYLRGMRSNNETLTLPVKQLRLACIFKIFLPKEKKQALKL